MLMRGQGGALKYVGQKTSRLRIRDYLPHVIFWRPWLLEWWYHICSSDGDDDGGVSFWWSAIGEFRPVKGERGLILPQNKGMTWQGPFTGQRKRGLHRRLRKGSNRWGSQKVQYGEMWYAGSRHYHLLSPLPPSPSYPSYQSLILLHQGY